MTFREKNILEKRRAFHSTYSNQKKNMNRGLTIALAFGLIVSSIFFFFNDNIKITLIVLFSVFLAITLFLYFRNKLSFSARIKKIENVFPDFLQLMSSNLRAGITVDRAMLLSAREEFDPLDKEILKTGRDITTGKDIERALLDMAKRINSERIEKTISLILSGLKSGGDVATLLEETAVNMRERSFMEKKAASNVLMYVIFIFLAVAVGAPALFGLSNILVEILTELLSNLPKMDASISVPFTLSAISISTKFVFYFSLLFMLAINLMASITLGLVSKGEEKEGLKYFLPISIISFSIFFLIKLSLSGFVKSFFG